MLVVRFMLFTAFLLSDALSYGLGGRKNFFVKTRLFRMCGHKEKLQPIHLQSFSTGRFCFALSWHIVNRRSTSTGGSMEIWKAAILGIVQGLSEFLPISSSGHLLFFERILDVDTEGSDLFLGVMLHAGTLAAVLVNFFPQIVQLFQNERKKGVFLILATIPAALVGFFLGDFIDSVFFGIQWLWLFFALTALLLFLSAKRLKRGYLLRPLETKSALAIGFAQAFAVLPGLSRSGTTIAAGLFCGLSKEEAADFSFLLSIPIIAGAVAAEFFKGLFGNFAIGISWQCLAVGSLCAAVFGFLSVRFMRKALTPKNLCCFSVYLLILAAATAGLNFFL